MINPPLLTEYNKYLSAHDFRGAADSLWPLLEFFPQTDPDREDLLMRIMHMERAAATITWKPSSGSPNRRSLESAQKAALLLLADDPKSFYSASVLIETTLMCGDQFEIAESLAIAEPLLPVAQNIDNSREAILLSSGFLLYYSLACLVCGRIEEAEKAYSRIPSNSEYRSRLYFKFLERFGAQPTSSMRALIEH